jgi:hypothetical protein
MIIMNALDSIRYEIRIIGDDLLCGLVVRVPGYRSTGPVFNSRRYQIF